MKYVKITERTLRFLNKVYSVKTFVHKHVSNVNLKFLTMILKHFIDIYGNIKAMKNNDTEKEADFVKNSLF